MSTELKDTSKSNVSNKNIYLKYANYLLKNKSKSNLQIFESSFFKKAENEIKNQ